MIPYRLHDGTLWRVIATFAKYYGRWACVGAAVPLDASSRLMLRAIKPDAKPYVIDDLTRMPVVVEGSLCEDKGYRLMREDIVF